MLKKNICNICNSNLKLKYIYTRRPRGETEFTFIKNYYRQIYKCSNCNHFFSIHKINLKKIYDHSYIKDTYGNSLEETFNKIIKLKKKNSDNKNRYIRFKSFINKYFENSKKTKILDIGSGLGVFPYILKKGGYNVTALDPNIDCCKLMRKNKIKNINSEFKIGIIKKKFDVISLNKVLEHIKKPEKILTSLRNNLKKKHIIYIELPDGESASKINKNREEFYIEHWHMYSEKSLSLFLKKNGMEVLKLSKIREPSNKFTLFAFAKFTN